MASCGQSKPSAKNEAFIAIRSRRVVHETGSKPLQGESTIIASEYVKLVLAAELSFVIGFL